MFGILADVAVIGMVTYAIANYSFAEQRLGYIRLDWQLTSSKDEYLVHVHGLQKP